MLPEFISHVPLLSSTGMGVCLLFPVRTGKRKTNSKPRLAGTHSPFFRSPLSLRPCNLCRSEDLGCWSPTYNTSQRVKPLAPQLHTLWSASLSWFLFQYQLTYRLWPTHCKFQNHCCFTWWCAYLPPPLLQGTRKERGTAAGSRETDACSSASAPAFTHGMDHSFLRTAQVSDSEGKAAHPTFFFFKNCSCALGMFPYICMLLITPAPVYCCW